MNSATSSTQTQAQNITHLYNLMGGATPFSPYMSGPPTDWTMPVIYNNVISQPITTAGTITSGPYNLVFDETGDAWIGDRKNGVVEIGPQGGVTTFSNASKGFGMVKGVAVSPLDGTIWVSDFGKNVLDVMDTTGTILATITKDLTSDGPVSTVFSLNSISGDNYMAYEVDETVPGIVAFDSGNYTASNPVSHYTGNSSSPQDYSGVSKPGWIYVDSTGVVWIPSTNTVYAGEMTVSSKSGTVKYGPTNMNMGATYTTVPEQLGMAADGLENVWAAATVPGVGTGLFELTGGTPSATALGGGLNTPYKTFIDGNNDVWVANGGANTVSGYQPQIGAASGFWFSAVGFSTSAASGTGAVVLGVDPSGNVWTGNSDQSVTQLLGLATPTAAPLYGGNTITTGTGKTAVTTMTNGNLGTKP
jgi:hypothetical protein